MKRATLLTDFGTQDGYIAAMKGVIASIAPSSFVDDAGHDIPHGDVLAALDYNALLPGFALLVGFFFISLFLIAVRGRGLSIDLLGPKYLWVFLVLLGVFGVVRNIPIYPFSILFP